MRKSKLNVNISFLKEQYRQLGNLNLPQIFLMIDFGIMVILWFTRQGIEELGFSGWGSLFGNYVSDATVSIFGVSLLYFIPVKFDGKWDRVLDKESLRDISWDILLILGGGFALAFGVKVSGLSLFISSQLRSLDSMNVLLLLVIICYIVVFLTEMLSNTALIAIVLPILADMAVQIGQNPLLFVIPVTLSSSYAFMLPIATPPNAIVFSSDRLKVSDMMKTGFPLNIVGVLVICGVLFLFKGIWGIEFNEIPIWAQNITGN
eukprot:TRINITY_DN6713_c0_g1_i1.p1 TRINITY_DN6713_c0_g1~~TRINITY_DN6713_c0_g1_i1.p1  ORF type:complete len:262 (-),score=38.94 TRINITY_DN6713_c0_g1_i1:1-786(-)